MKFTFIKDHKAEFPVVDMCRVLAVSKSGFYRWSKSPVGKRERARQELGEAIARVHQSNRGVQYARGDYQALLKAHGLHVSMSGVGNCYDNAPTESFWGKLKTELVYLEHFASREQARAAIFDYIECFYNRVRLHSSLGYVSPERFEVALT